MITQSGEHNEVLSQISNGDRAAFKFINFDKAVNQASIRVKRGKGKGQIRLRLDQPWHQEIAKFDLAEGESDWQTISVPLSSKASGDRTLWVMVYGEGAVEAIDWIVFD